MAKSIKVRAKAKDGVATIKVLISHAMETGMRKNKKTGKKFPAQFIQEVTCKHNGNEVLSADWGTAISKNPYLSFKFSGAKSGDSLQISWADNKGESDTVDAKIK